MAMNSKRKGNKTLCEKSLKMVLNVVKLSSFSIARITVGNNRSPAIKSSVKGLTCPSLPQASRTKRAQGPTMISKPVSYLIEPDTREGSLYLVNEENSIDYKASNYIKKVHERNRWDLDEASRTPANVLPPPPHVLI